MPELDIGFVRAQFPALSGAAPRGRNFFENAGGSWPCRQVVDRLTRFYRERKVQPYWDFEPSRLGGEEMDEARERLAAMLGVAPDELHFGPSTSQNTYVLARAFAGLLRPGEAIIVTDQDHEANSGAWRRLASEGIEVREWQVDRDTGHLDPAGLARLLDGRVRLVCFPHCSNVVGEINPVADLCAMVHEAGAVACVDGVSYAPHGLPDVAALGADIYLFSAYKTYGPHQGLMTVRAALADRLPNQGHFFNGTTRTKRLTPAGPDHAQIAACAGIADYVDALHAHHAGASAPPAARAGAVHAMMRARERALAAPLLDWLRGRNGVRLLGPADPDRRAPTVALVHARRGEALAAELAGLGMMCGGGSFYANRLVAAMGVDPGHGALRLSLVHYTEEAEVAALIAALDRVL